MTDPGPSTPPSGVRAQGKARTREKLLDAAAAVLADRGFDAALHHLDDQVTRLADDRRLIEDLRPLIAAAPSRAP